MIRGIVVCLLFIAVPTYAQSPLESFVSCLRAKHRSDLWFADKRTSSPKGGYLIKTEIDLRGDGTTEVLLASTLDMEEDSVFWNVYTGYGTESWTTIGAHVLIDPGTVLVRSGDSKTTHSYLGYSTKGRVLRDFTIGNNGMVQMIGRVLTQQELDALEGADPETLDDRGILNYDKIAKKFGWGRFVDLPIKKLMLGKYVKSGKEDWQSTNDEFTLSQQYFDPADVDEIQELGTWNPPQW